MPLALGLLVVVMLQPFVGAIRTIDNEIFAFPSNDSPLLGFRYDEKSEIPTRDYSVTKILPDGELRRITRWNGLCARETIVHWGDTNVALREVSLRDSRRKLRLIYEDETLTDCVDEISTTTKSGNDDCSLVDHRSESPDESRIQILESEKVSGDFSYPELRWLATTGELRKRCGNARRTRARSFLIATRQSQQRRTKRGLQQMVIAPGTKWCGPHRTANSYKELGALDNVDRCCRRHDHCYRAIPPFSERYNMWNYMPFTLSHCGCDQRKRGISKDSLAVDERTLASRSRKKRKRRIRTGGGESRSRKRRELLLIPGTKWCGRGNRATKYTNLGGFGKADACCRRHDTACPFYIPAFESRYGLFNWGISTIMHCTCDERFRTCLKMAGTSSANFIGRIFFNVVQTKCFVLKPHKVCVKQSWWGKCEKHEYKKQAHLRDNVPY